MPSNAPQPPDEDPAVDLVAEALTVLERDGAPGLEAFLRAHPAEAARVRRRLALLGEHGLAGGSDAAPVEAIGEQIGEFRLLRPLGGGGMGIVWLAEQSSLGREVALKIVRPDQLLFPGARERFRREVETVARLQHPGIVPVYTVGEERGLPYFTMERVHGLSLAEVVHALADRDPRALTGRDLEALLPADGVGSDGSALFDGAWTVVCMRIAREVAEALEHARRRGIVHRDVKPSNVMVTRGGRVLLLDFGLSWRVDDARITRTGSAVGSLAYMPPEAVEQDVAGDDPRQDVYALGASLYELVALRPPFAEKSRVALIRAIVEGRAAALRAGRPDVSWELDTIVSVAMERDPERRYASAGALARDLANALERRPIEARPPGAALRARRWVQRHPARAVLLAALCVGPSVLFAREVQSRRAVERALEEARAQRELAQQSFRRALDAVDRMLLRVGEHRLAGEPRMEGVRRELLADAVDLYGWFLARGEGEPGLGLEYARVALSAGDLNGMLGDLPAAERVIDLAESRLADLVAADAGDVDAVVSLAEVRSRRATVRRLDGRTEDAESAARGAVALLAGVPPARLDQHGRQDRSRVLASAWSELGLLAQLGGDLDGAIEAFDRAIQELRAMAHDGPEGAKVRSDLARDLDLRGGLRALRGAPMGGAHDQEELERALADHGEAADLFASLVADSPGLPDPRFRHARALTNQVNVLGLLGGHDERVMALAREASRVQADLASDFPSVPGFVNDLARTQINLSAFHGQRGDLAGCEDALELAFAAFDRVLALTPDDASARTAYGTALVNLSGLRQSQGDLTGSLAALERAGEELAAALERQPDDVRTRGTAWMTAYRAASVLLQLARPLDAVASAEGMLAHGPGPDEVETFATLAASALALVPAGDPEAAAARVAILGRAAAGLARALASGALEESALATGPAYVTLFAADGFAEALDGARAR